MPRRLIITGRIALVIPAIIGFGLLTWVPFAYAGLRMRNWIILGIAIFFTAIAVFEIVSIETHGDGEFFVVMWVVGLLAYAITLKWWLPWRLPPARPKAESDTLTTGIGSPEATSRGA